MMVWRSKRERHERNNTLAALVIVVVLLAWAFDVVRGWFGW